MNITMESRVVTVNNNYHKLAIRYKFLGLIKYNEENGFTIYVPEYAADHFASRVD